MVSMASGPMSCSTYSTTGFDDWSTTVLPVSVGRRSNITYLTYHNPDSTASSDFNTSVKYGQDYFIAYSDIPPIPEPPKKIKKVAFYEFMRQPNRIFHLIPPKVVHDRPKPVRSHRASVFNSLVCRRRDPAKGAL